MYFASSSFATIEICWPVAINEIRFWTKRNNRLFRLPHKLADNRISFRLFISSRCRQEWELNESETNKWSKRIRLFVRFVGLNEMTSNIPMTLAYRRWWSADFLASVSDDFASLSLQPANFSNQNEVDLRRPVTTTISGFRFFTNENLQNHTCATANNEIIRRVDVVTHVRNQR